MALGLVFPLPKRLSLPMAISSISPWQTDSSSCPPPFRRLSADPSLSGLGTLSAPFTYDLDSGSFSLVPDFTLSLYEPVSPSR